MTPRKAQVQGKNEKTSLHFMEDMILCMERIRDCDPDLKSRTSFDEDPRALDALIRNILILGEAVKGVSAETKGKHPEFPWRRTAGLKGRITRKKPGIDPDVLSDFFGDELPALLKTLKKIYVLEKNHRS
jgi:uncharacterized protein with HEPN domain